MRIYKVRGRSMLPSICDGDRLLVSTGAAEGRRSRGEIVVYRRPGANPAHSLKRVVGLPGEVIRLRDGMLFIDGEHHVEPYLRGLPAAVGPGDRSWRVGAGEYFVMGDDRAHSTDSRRHGPIGAELIVGRAWLRIWPPNRLGSLRRRP